MLALALGKTLKEIGRLTPAELESWREFYLQFPFDDFHRYHRPAAFIATSQVSKSRDEAIQSALSWLQPDLSPTDNYSDADLRTMKALGIKKPRG